MTTLTPNIETPFYAYNNQEIVSIVKMLRTAFRNFSLYSRDHVLCTQSIDHLFLDITKFTNQKGELALGISHDTISYEGTPIESVQGDDAFVSPLIRDGISHVKFLKGLQKKSIYTLFEIILKNRTLGDKPEGDTVTDLWKADFKHIVYESAEIYLDRNPVFVFPTPNQFEPEPLIERSFRRSSKKKKQDAKENGNEKSEQNAQKKPLNLDGPHFSENDIILSAEEQRHLNTMVAEHESKRTEDEILNLLLLVINAVSRPEDLENILSNLSVEFHRILKNGEMKNAYDIIASVKKYHGKHDWMDASSEEKLQAFLDHISGEIFMDSYLSLVPVLNKNQTEDIAFFKKLCLALAPSVAVSLCEAIVYLESQATKDFIIDIIKIKTREDVSVIERMLESTDKMIALIGVSLLKNLKDTHSDLLLQGMLKHPVEEVRSSALDYFLDKPLSVLPRIFFMIDDTSEDVTHKLMKFVGSRRYIPSESLMLDYIEDLIYFPAKKEHILLCYKTLGQCGSQRSIPLLKKRLFGSTLIKRTGIKLSDHRIGALTALSELKHSAASKLLAKASKSKLPSVIKAYRMFYDHSSNRDD